LRAEVLREHLGASMGAVAKAAPPPDPAQDYASPGSANYELHRLVVTRMKNNPRLSYEQAFTTEYLAPENRSLKERVTSRGDIAHAAPCAGTAVSGLYGAGASLNLVRRAKGRACFNAFSARGSNLQPGSPSAKAMIVGCGEVFVDVWRVPFSGRTVQAAGA
jgi:hypothetical protein